MKNHAEASQRAAPSITPSHAVCTPDTALRTSVLRQLALILVNTPRQDNVKVTAEANIGRTQTLRPSAPVPHLKRRMGFPPLALQFTRMSVSTFHMFPSDAPRYTVHYCIATGTRNSPHQPSPTATSHTLHSLPRGTIPTSPVTTPMETRCQPNVATPVVLPRPPDNPTEKESGSADTIFTDWLLH